MDILTLSASTLSLYTDCPRCFWLKLIKKIERPRGPVPTIMSGLDLVIKAYFNQYRGKDVLPPIVAGKIPGRLFREVPPWLTKGDPETNTKLVGKLDELLEPEPGLVAPIDHKTRGKKADDIHKAYQLQMDVYDLLLGASGFKTIHKAWLVYYIPDVMEQNKFSFAIDVHETMTDPERANNVFSNAAKVARGTEPPANADCEYCRWFDLRAKELASPTPGISSEEAPF